MAVGVPENDVFAAADTVLARGERPTVERVRLELGRGSPARVGGLLDQWWARLAERLSGETRLPTLPGEVSQAFVAVWQQAILLAQGVAEQALAEQRQVLDTERERIAAVEDQARQDAAQFRQQATDAVAGRQAAELRLADLELLLAQRQIQIEDLQQQREGLLHERSEAQQHNQALQQELQALRLKAEQERVAQESYVRGVEDRAHREVDRAREEGKATAAQLKEVGRQVEQLQQRLESIQTELSQTQQRAAAQQARADTLEQHLTQLRQAPATKRKPRSRKPAASVSDRKG
ncbi:MULTISPECIES: DNA-binding protein [unclassified Pseudomonas]|uniref:DNA-binding protein n=1 Tax=unclassified Pseudomonas TaxID=196821 RepID=UPI000CD0242A|nr:MULTISPECIES: DNA-binding protein [unclassified Pseudomonas]POA28511.1 plasmid replication region [Pseudomonas sp. GW456-R21]POA71559.1 plasmid replication region [Pseudomonas sp. GW460-R15]